MLFNNLKFFIVTLPLCYRRLRGLTNNELRYKLDLNTLQVTEHSVEADLINTENNVILKFTLNAIAGNTFRVLVDEKEPLYPRYKVTVAFQKEPQLAR